MFCVLKGLSRNRRQFDASSPAQIDLNITVPFIFSARLYPYGESKGDKILDPSLNTQAYILKNELTFLEENYTAIYVSEIYVCCYKINIEKFLMCEFRSVKTV